MNTYCDGVSAQAAAKLRLLPCSCKTHVYAELYLEACPFRFPFWHLICPLKSPFVVSEKRDCLSRDPFSLVSELVIAHGIELLGITVMVIILCGHLALFNLKISKFYKGGGKHFLDGETEAGRGKETHSRSLPESLAENPGVFTPSPVL